MELIFGEKKVVKSYDNEGAMQTVKAMMKRGEQLNVKFYTNKDNYQCAWIDKDFQLSIFKQLIQREKHYNLFLRFVSMERKLLPVLFSEKERFSSGWKGQKSYMIIYWKKN